MLHLPQIIYTDIDLFSPDVRQNMNITDLRLKDDHFDGIICSHVFEHVVDDHKVLSELYRVLKVSGHVLIMVPQGMDLGKTDEDPNLADPRDCYIRFGHPYHVRTCGSDYAERFTKVGFHVASVSSNSLAKEKRRLDRLNKCPIFSCKKCA